MTSTSTNCAPNSTTSPSRRRRAAARRARSASSPDSRKSSGSSRQHGRAPQHGEDRDIFERLYAVRLDRLRALEECRVASRAARPSGTAGGRGNCSPLRRRRRWTTTSCWPNWRVRRAQSDITELRHVRTSADKRAAEEIANRAEVRGLRRLQAAVRSRFRRSSKPASGRHAPVRAEGRNQAGQLVHRRRPEGLCRRDGRGVHRRRNGERTRGCA